MLITDIIDATRSGCSIAIVWAIIPPIDAPTTWARSTPRWSSRPIASAAMSDSVYGDLGDRLAAGDGRHHGHRVDGLTVELRRQAAVAVVEADDVVALGGEELAEPGVPVDQLGA